ncbi:MAG: BolA family transcriptional regulator [Armatimonadetes bacterium]|nr:BolA family transcriptional regulator [Armatimonadota bacterium]
METKLREAFQPTRLVIENVSGRHAGHASSPGTGESHFNALVVSEHFQGKSRVLRHRMVYEVLAEEIAGPIHALSLTLLAPGED